MKRGALIAVAVLLILGVLITGLVLYFNKEETKDLEKVFYSLQAEAKIANYYVSNEEDIARHKADITGFDGEIIYSIAGHKGDFSVYVHEMESKDVAKEAYELILPLLPDGDIWDAKYDGKYLIFGSKELTELIDI